MSRRSLEEHLSAAAQEIGAAVRAAADSGLEFQRDGQPFAFVKGDAAEVRLDPEIAEAALRTPATESSSRGPGWVRLAPAEPTQMDLDRARAWFLSAWRAAEK